MKRVIVSLVLLLSLIFSAAMPVYADAPTLEEWELYRDSRVHVTYLINMTNLKTTQFNIVNNSHLIFRLYVEVKNVVDWEVLVDPYTTISTPYVLNFQKLPATDPDDPDSIRYPNNTVIGTQYRLP